MKALFMRISRREKYMLVLFLLAVAIVWGGNLIDRAGALSQGFSSVGYLLEEQTIVLDNAEDIEARMRAGVENLDPERILSGTRLMNELDTIARSHGLSREINPPRSDEGEVFFFHLVNVTVRQANIGSLMAFADDVQRRAPYMGLEEVSLTADRNDPRMLNATFRISSVELSP